MTINHTKKNIGALFKNEHRKSPKAPTLTGVLELDRSLIKYLVDRLNSGEDPILNLAAWKNKSKEGKNYFTLKAQPEFVADEYKLPFAEVSEEDVFSL